MDRSTRPDAPGAGDAATSLQPAVRRAATDTAVVAVAMTLANLLGYALALTAARRLGPANYGALASLLAVVLVGYVSALGLQTVTARRMARGARPQELLRVAVSAAGLTGLVVAASAWTLASFLHLGNASAVLGVAATLVPLTWLGFVQGVSQGLERFGLLALVLLVHAVGKVGGGMVALLTGGSVAVVMWATALGTLLAAMASTGLVLRAVPTWRGSTPHGSEGAPAETAHAVHALLALYLLTNLDLVLARHELSADAAGQYAVGAIMTKAAFWLPQFVAVVALPRLADPKRRRAAARNAVAALAVVGGVATVFTAILGDFAISVVGGSAYASLAPYAWLFVLLGSLFALAQLLLYDRLAQRDRSAVAVLWLALAALSILVVAQAQPSLVSIVVPAVAVAGSVVGVGLVVTFGRLPRRLEAARG